MQVAVKRKYRDSNAFNEGSLQRRAENIISNTHLIHVVPLVGFFFFLSSAHLLVENHSYFFLPPSATVWSALLRLTKNARRALQDIQLSPGSPSASKTSCWLAFK